MRNIISLNENWAFVKDVQDVHSDRANAEIVNVPHSWNAIDGQDGGNDYFRGTCLYAKKIVKADLPENEEYYLEINGANSSGDVYLNGEHLAHHDGGYSTWRVRLTDKLLDENDLAILVDNAANETVYPQMADFTFYGGLYRNVNMICVPKTHFDLEYYGGPGLTVTPIMDGENAKVTVQAYLTNGDGATLKFTLLDKEGNIVAETTKEDTMAEFTFGMVERTRICIRRR